MRASSGSVCKPATRSCRRCQARQSCSTKDVRHCCHSSWDGSRQECVAPVASRGSELSACAEGAQRCHTLRWVVVSEVHSVLRCWRALSGHEVAVIRLELAKVLFSLELHSAQGVELHGHAKISKLPRPSLLAHAVPIAGHGLPSANAGRCLGMWLQSSGWSWQKCTSCRSNSHTVHR